MTDGGLEEVREYMRARLTEDRNLGPDELAVLAEDLAGHPELWRGFVHHNAEERIYTEIHRDHHLDVWLICWSGAQQTGLHDHDLSGGAVRVIEGELAEDRLVFGSGVETVGYSGGDGFRFDSSRIHDVRHIGETPAVSLHLYSPPLWRMGYYDVGDDGRISRRSTSYAEEFQL
ncbi:MAG TPA: cysteine dioxygenase family protein [Gaiellales bacterium]|jgi:Cysteine dioxygenase type I|nr:cysteine dioxygenase family protein [Gaiellales bacterium]